MLSLNAKQSQIKTRSALLLNYEETPGLSKSFSFQKLCLFILRRGKLEFFPIRERGMTASDGEVLAVRFPLPPSLFLSFYFSPSLLSGHRLVISFFCDSYFLSPSSGLLMRSDISLRLPLLFALSSTTTLPPHSATPAPPLSPHYPYQLS